MEGTQTGTRLEIPPTNKPVTIRMMTVHRIARGKIAENWVLVESLGFFQQLGLALQSRKGRVSHVCPKPSHK